MKYTFFFVLVKKLKFYQYLKMCVQLKKSTRNTKPYKVELVHYYKLTHGLS